MTPGGKCLIGVKLRMIVCHERQDEPKCLTIHTVAELIKTYPQLGVISMCMTGDANIIQDFRER